MRTNFESHSGYSDFSLIFSLSVSQNSSQTNITENTSLSLLLQKEEQYPIRNPQERLCEEHMLSLFAKEKCLRKHYFQKYPRISDNKYRISPQRACGDRISSNSMIESFGGN